MLEIEYWSVAAEVAKTATELPQAPLQMCTLGGDCTIDMAMLNCRRCGRIA